MASQAWPSPSQLHWPAIIRAAVSVATFAVPIGLLQNWLTDSNRIAADGATNYALFGVILLCGAIGGFGAAMLVNEHKLQHGAAAAAVATLAIHVAGAIRRAFAGEAISSPIAWLFTAMLMATCGMIGAALERKTQGLRATPTIRED